MNKTVKLIVTILTVLTALVMLGLTIFALTIPHWGLFVTCFLLTGAVGFFLRNDYYYWFKKDGTAQSESR